MDLRAHLRELKRTWKPPIELERSRPRDVRLTGAGKAVLSAVLILLIGACAAGMILYLKASNDLEQRRQLLAAGRDGQAQVIRRWQRRGEKNQYWTEYQYWIGERSYRARMRIGRAGWQALEVGSTIPLRYLPSDPQLHVVPGHEAELMPIWLPYLISGAMLTGAWFSLRPIKGQRRLLAEGRPTAAIVTRQTKTANGLEAHYTFATLSGAVVEGKTSPQKKGIPSPGEILCVIYEPDRARRNARYPLPLVRLDRLPSPTKSARQSQGPRGRGAKEQRDYKSEMAIFSL